MPEACVRKLPHRTWGPVETHRGYRDYVGIGLGFKVLRDITPLMENDMEKQMEDEMAAGMQELTKIRGPPFRDSQE